MVQPINTLLLSCRSKVKWRGAGTSTENIKSTVGEFINDARDNDVCAHLITHKLRVLNEF